jgi:Fe-S cluster biogenesis protein NfuA/nitrite reductase/ring-hydroxylating ferredoxin subunit
MTTTETAEPTFEELAARVDAAVSAVASMDISSRATADELRAAVEAFHRDALVAIVRHLRADDHGRELLFQLVDLPSVHAVFALHGIIKAPLMTRAMTALDSVRPYLQSHGGDVELVEIREGVAFVRLQGSCNGCSMSAITLREGVEEALVSGVDEITAIDVLPTEPTEASIPLTAIGRKPTDTGWVPGPATDDIADGAMVRFDVDDDSFVITNIGNRFAVFRNECVHQGMTLDGGSIDENTLTCPWHGFRFDATTGECLSSPGAQLQQVPLRIEDRRVWVRAH